MTGDRSALADVSRETSEKLHHLADAVTRWTRKINLVSASSIRDIHSRHIADSARLFQLAPPWSRWVDLGAGGGFPGLVVAILAAEDGGARTVTLIESDTRKAAFLRLMVREMTLSATVLAERIEVVDPLGGDVVSSRALAPLPTLLPMVARHLSPKGTALLPKGRSYRAELDEVNESWTFDLTTHKSNGDPASAILEMRGLQHV